MIASDGFRTVDACWICGARTFTGIHEASFDLSEYRRQDPELAAYSGTRVVIQRCTSCDFAQPAALPALPRFFDRMYDQRWADDWIANEHEDDYKDLIFTDILDALAHRAVGRGRLLDIGAHAGRFLRLARREGWEGDGLELNPKTAAFAARLSNAVVQQGDVRTFHPDRCYEAVTLIDVLEHIPCPLEVLSRVRTFLSDGGWVAIKVPNGPAQRLKENLHARLTPGHRATLADNLVHVNHFSVTSLMRALERTGFHEITVVAAAPELPDRFASRALRLAAFRVARALPGGVGSPLAFNLQAYGRRD